jgi:hypothetical protein
MYYLYLNAISALKALLFVLQYCMHIFNSVYIVNRACLLGFGSKNPVSSLLGFLHQGQSRVLSSSTTVQV